MMLVLDTNVLSELMKPQGSDEVSTWLERQEPAALYTTAITQAEILSGIAILPAGKRSSAIQAAAQALFAEDLHGRVLAFDELAATAYAKIFAHRRGAGAATLELMVAAIAHSHGANIVTRDVRGFDGFGVQVINPWDEINR